MEQDHLLLLCTCPDDVVASEIATALVAEQLAACVNRLPGIQSVFRWEGSVETQGEELLLIKTTGQAYPAVEARISELHPYELPEIVAVPITRGSAAYLQWMSKSIR